MPEPDPPSLRGYLLIHSFTSGLTPFGSIMDLPREEALRLEDAFLGKCSSRDAAPATRIASYYAHRIEVEDWLRHEAAGQGIVIRARHPVYFRLGLETGGAQRADKQHMTLPIENVDLSCCSFTVGDSFPNHRFIESEGKDSYNAMRHEFLGRVMPLADACLALAGLAAIQNEDYVEVQMWDRPAL